MATLDKAIRVAAQVHEGQVDRYGQPYILHPIRVMMRVEGELDKIAAILHDVIEDSEMTLEELSKEGFHQDIIAAIDCLSKRDQEAYFDYLERVKPNAVAVRVKLADLQDNLDLTRVSDPAKFDGSRFARYLQARAALQAVVVDLPSNEE